jgi:tetratricopeptide (TPR) repeat protein
MKKHLYILFSVLALTFLMISCSSEDPLITPIKKSISAQNYDAAIAAADTAIMAEPTNGIAYYYKGDIYNKLAQNEEIVANRKPYYAEMSKNLKKAAELFEAAEKAPKEANLIENMVNASWSKEHNAAIGFATVDSIANTVEQPLVRSIEHLENATTVNPDSSLSFEILAQVYALNEQWENAAKTLRKAVDLQGGVGETIDYDRMASYYFQLNDFNSALAVIEEGLALYPDSISLVQKVADAYFQTGQVDKALEVVKDLIEQEPDNATYRLVVGTQIYQRVQILTDELSDNNDRLYDLRNDDNAKAEQEELTARNKEILAQTDELIVEAEEALLKAAELDPTNVTTFNTLGILYQNNAAALFDQRNSTLDNDEASRFDELAKIEATKAMKYYEKAVEIEPNNQSIWETLSRIYLLLDLREKAEDAMNKAGM